MIQGYHFQNSVLTISKSTQVSKVAGLDSLSGSFLKDGAKFLAKPISDLCNLSINSEKFLALCKVAQKGSLTKSCNYRPVTTSLVPIISRVIEKVIHNQTNTFLNSKNLLYIYQSGFWKNHSPEKSFPIWMTRH